MTRPAHGLEAMAQQQLAAMRGDVLLQLADGSSLGHADGYEPLLVQFTREDGAARGLRRLGDRSSTAPAEHLSALEAIQRAEATLVEAPAGWGKTTFARHVTLNLAGARLGDGGFNEARLRAPTPRHDHGTAEAQLWDQPAYWPILVDIVDPASFEHAVQAAWPEFHGWLGLADRPPVILLIDHAERLHDHANGFLKEAQAAASNDLRIVVLADSTASEHWRLPGAISRHRLMPLNRAQRRQGGAASVAPAGLHAVSLAVGPDVASAEELVDRWLHQQAPGRASEIAEDYLSSLDRGAATGAAVAVPQHLRELIVAAHIADADIGTVVAAFARAPVRMASVVASVFRRWDGDRRDGLAEALTALPGDAGRRGALVAADADHLGGTTRRTLVTALLPIVAEGLLSPGERIRAGARLSELGDPRDLAELVRIDGGHFRMGSSAHENSAPPFDADIAAFRMARYPVTNALYASFVAETRRDWQSGDRELPDRTNAPAVNLSWHDARAFCAWLTQHWRREGRIDATEACRLPTEPEWERAARGDIDGPGSIFPWGSDWRDDCANAEPIGHNDTCAVGLFPAGAAPYGCLDMAGQVWEWTSTLWGRAMESPFYRYPYVSDDGREDASAGPDVRRVLRGGCFTGGAAKANSTYRGSLEPAGTWRGNGFRVVVAKEHA